MSFSYQKIKTRSLILQAVYQHLVGGTSLIELKSDFLDRLNQKKVDPKYFDETLKGILENTKRLDAELQITVDRPYKKLEIVVLAILYLGTYELMFYLHIPYVVIINQAVELAKQFSSDDGYRYVNAILDKIALNVRSMEVKQKQQELLILKNEGI